MHSLQNCRREVCGQPLWPPVRTKRQAGHGPPETTEGSRLSRFCLLVWGDRRKRGAPCVLRGCPGVSPQPGCSWLTLCEPGQPCFQWERALRRVSSSLQLCNLWCERAHSRSCGCERGRRPAAPTPTRGASLAQDRGCRCGLRRPGPGSAGMGPRLPSAGSGPPRPTRS